jgi:hypothetical protein
MGISTEKLKKEIFKRLEKLEKSEIEIYGKTYPLYIFDKDEDINLFEGIFFAEGDKKEDISNFLGYKPATGYVGRVGILIYRNEDLLIKDFRSNRQIRKTIAKINEPFLKKLKKALEEPKDENFSALFSRSDVVEEFYILYKKCREFLLNNIRGISEEERREEFVDNFMMQMLTLWYLQEKGFFNRDRRYFITKFDELKQKKLFGGFECYYDFLRHFFRQISGYSDRPYVEDESIGKCVVIGPAVFLNGEDDEAITIPDKCFYQEGVTEKLVNLTPKGRRRMISENDVDFDIPLLNLFESRDWVDGDIDEYVLGSLYEKLITYMERKKLGAFYTPEEITSYICKNTIEPYLVDRINEEFGKSYGSIDEIINAGEKKELLKLFDLLQNIKILDPAVGSAHFLESAINVLVDIYRKLRDKAEEVGIKKLDILVANEEGKIEPLNLLEIPEKVGLFEVYVKFFIILSRNIYGVDINPSALKVARARLFLTLARHFNVNAGVFIRFPNVHFNLREGNSLIGYVDVPRGQKEVKQATLVEFGDHEIEYIQERIRVDEELKEYLPEIAKLLRIEGDLVKEIQEMNSILSSKKIKWGDFEKVLRTKEKLIQVLVALLNSRYAVKLNKLLRDITELFNKKLDEKFAEEHGIDLEDLKKIKTFHWIFEFPEVFLEKGGFDVVVGNPPYLRIQIMKQNNPVHFEMLSKTYEVAFKNYDISLLFIERGYKLLNHPGEFGFIVTNKWLHSDYGQKLRELLKREAAIRKIINFGDLQVFRGITTYTMILLLNRKAKDEFGYSEVGEFIDNKINHSDFEKSIFHVKFSELCDDSWKFVRKDEKEILGWLTRYEKLKDFAENIFVGIQTSADKVYHLKLISTNPESYRVFSKSLQSEIELEKNLLKPLLSGQNVNKYSIEWDGTLLLFPYKIDEGSAELMDRKILEDKYPNTWKYLLENKETLENRENGKMKGEKWYAYGRHQNLDKQEQRKLVIPRLVKELQAAFDSEGMFYLDNVDVNGISLKNNSTSGYLTFMCLLNSRLLDFCFKKESVSYHSGYYSANRQFIENLPIVLPKDAFVFTVLSSYCVVYSKLDEFILFLDDLINNLTYELYFKQKFIEDSKKAIEEGKEPIYPQLGNGPFLIDLVAKYLKPIDYDSYAKLAYSIEPLSEEEKQKMEEMKEEYLKTIKEVVETIKADREIMGLIERIRQHEWVRVIEGGR